MPQSNKVSFHTLGCKLNFSETSTIARRFEQEGYKRTVKVSEADICIINTCAVTEHAEKKCRNLIRKLHRETPNAIIAVTGCYAQLRPAEIAAIEGVDLVLSNRDKCELFDRVAELTSKTKAHIYSCDTADLTNFFAAFSSGDRTRSFLKVQDGCDYKCAYCTIHYARGGSRNMPIDDIVCEAKQIAAGGQKEQPGDDAHPLADDSGDPGIEQDHHHDGHGGDGDQLLDLAAPVALVVAHHAGDDGGHRVGGGEQQGEGQNRPLLQRAACGTVPQSADRRWAP